MKVNAISSEKGEKPDPSTKHSKHDRIVFVGGIPKTIEVDKGEESMTASIFANWARKTFGQRIAFANLRTHGEKCLGYGFLTFKSIEDAQLALRQHRFECFGVSVEFKPVTTQTSKSLKNKVNRDQVCP